MKKITDGTIKTIIFDMDGTIYQLDGDNNGFKNSSLHKLMTKNTINFFSEKESISIQDAQKLFDKLNEDHSFPSVYASEKYDITRKDFFDIVWNIDPNQIVCNFEVAVSVIQELAKRNTELILLSQAPKVWQKSVFQFLKINDLFTEIYTGEDYLHKIEMFPKISKTRHPHTILSVGDQLETDILPAKKLGFRTLHVTSPNDLLQLIQNEQ